MHVGHFKEGKKHGRGLSIVSSSAYIGEGDYKNDKLHGYCK